MTIWFEDIEVGERARFGAYPVTREEVIDFARRWDPQPFHLDDAAAARTHFGRVAASGWHSCAMTMAMLVDYFASRRIASLGSPGIDELRWVKPVYPGDTLGVEWHVLDKSVSRSRPEMGRISVTTTVFNQHDEPVMQFRSIILIARRPAD